MVRSHETKPETKPETKEYRRKEQGSSLWVGVMFFGNAHPALVFLYVPVSYIPQNNHPHPRASLFLAGTMRI